MKIGQADAQLLISDDLGYEDNVPVATGKQLKHLIICFTIAPLCWFIHFHTLYDVSFKCLR